MKSQNIAHTIFLKGDNFEEELVERTYSIDNYLTWEKGSLHYFIPKRIDENFPLSRIKGFRNIKGMYCFDIEGEKSAVTIDLPNAMNPVFVIELGNAIASLNKINDNYD